MPCNAPACSITHSIFLTFIFNLYLIPGKQTADIQYKINIKKVEPDCYEKEVFKNTRNPYWDYTGQADTFRTGGSYTDYFLKDIPLSSSRATRSGTRWF